MSHSVLGVDLCCWAKELASSRFVFSKYFKLWKAGLSFSHPARQSGTPVRSTYSRFWIISHVRAAALRPRNTGRTLWIVTFRLFGGLWQWWRGNRVPFLPLPELWLLIVTEKWNSIVSPVLLPSVDVGKRIKIFLLSFPFLIPLIIMGQKVEGKWKLVHSKRSEGMHNQLLIFKVVVLFTWGG